MIECVSTTREATWMNEGPWKKRPVSGEAVDVIGGVGVAYEGTSGDGSRLVGFSPRQPTTVASELLLKYIPKVPARV